jgi:glycosyltransferase involved in cell wall biosynthesis
LSQAPAPILFTHYGEDWIRGSERCLLDLLAHIDRSRFRPVAWCNGETLAGELRRIDVPVHVSPFSVLFLWDSPHWAFGSYLRLMREGLSLVRHHGARLIHSNSGAPNQWLLPVARGAGVPLLTHLHVPYIVRDRMALLLHHATLVVGVTTGCIEGLLEDGMPAARTKTIYNGVDPEEWGRGDETGLRARLGITSDEIVLTRVGSLIQRKGVDLMLRVFQRLLAERPRCHLLVAGEGPDRSGLEAMARDLGVSERVHFLGFVPSSGAVLRDATDIAVSPARVEGFGLTVIEAGLAARPVVATNTTGMTEILRSGENGVIVPVGSEPALLAALRELVDRKDLRERYGHALLATVQQRFLTASYVRAFEETYAALLAGDPRDWGWRGPWSSPSIYTRWIAQALERRWRGAVTPRGLPGPGAPPAK